MVKLDSLYLVSQPAVAKSGWGAFAGHSYNQEALTTFRFKSHLSISDPMGKDVARLLVVEPSEDIYSIQQHPWSPGRKSSIPVVFLMPKYLLYFAGEMRWCPRMMNF